jgi:FdhD protein
MIKDIELAWVEYTKVNSEVTRARERVVTEFALSIFINSKPLATAMITPAMEKEFLVGHLFGQGLIDGVKDILSIEIRGNTAQVYLAENWSKGNKAQAVRSDLKLSREDIFEGVKAILKSDIFAETEALHSAGLFGTGAKAICMAEDIGRHNALDKVVGYGLLNEVDFGSSFVTTTGRMPAEMVLRCCNANVPIIASKGVPTSLGIDIARKVGITIAGLVRGEGMTIYSNVERVF